MASIENDYQGSDVEVDEPVPQPYIDDAAVELDDYEGLPEEMDEDAEADVVANDPPPQADDEDEDETFTGRDENVRTTANSRKKRKSDGEPAPRPAKKPKSKNLTKSKKTKKASMGWEEDGQEEDESQAMPPPRGRGRPPNKAKEKKAGMSKRQAAELDDVVERVKARPNPPRSLYILRKETPADPDVRLTRSGRMTVKPLAYWRNERCVWGGSPKSELKEGTRFPMNSIKEIIRTEDNLPAAAKKKKGRKGKAKNKTTADAAEAAEGSSSDEEATNVEPWEIETGTVRGNVSEWDSYHGLPLNVEQDIEIAHSNQAIQTYVPAAKNGQEPAQFRYSKLFSNTFMSVGLVDLPPGGIKKPKNSQKMQMTFYVLKGRVTVSVGPILGEMTTFGIGKGGFWQVPRGECSSDFGAWARRVANSFLQEISIRSRMSTVRKRDLSSVRVAWSLRRRRKRIELDL